MIKAVLTALKSKKALHTYEGLDGEPVLVVTTHAHQNGYFKAAQRSTAGTTVIAQPNGNDAICLTDMIITTDKVNGASLTVQITDGVNTIILASALVTDAPCNIAIPFQGNWTGWQAAHVDMVTVSTVAATVSLGYYKIPADKALPYAAWNALR